MVARGCQGCVVCNDRAVAARAPARPCGLPPMGWNAPSACRQQHALGHSTNTIDQYGNAGCLLHPTVGQARDRSVALLSCRVTLTSRSKSAALWLLAKMSPKDAASCATGVAQSYGP